MKKQPLRWILLSLSLLAHPLFNPAVAAEPATNRPVGGVDHVGLTVSKLEASKDFFANTLGFRILGKDPNYPAYFLNNGAVMITLWQTVNGEQATPFNRKTNVGLHHLAFQVDSQEKLNQLYQKLKATPGIKIEFSPENLGSGPTQHMMIYEPSGNRIEFIHRVRAGMR